MSSKIIQIRVLKDDKTITNYDEFGEVSDGYHTFKELYEFRLLYNAAFFNELYRSHQQYDVYKSWRHSDGRECFDGGWFIVMTQLPTGQISNHYEAKDWPLFDIGEYDKAAKWDGHTAQDAAKRLRNYLEGPKND